MRENERGISPPDKGDDSLVPFLTVIQGPEKGVAKAITKKRFIVGRKVGDFLITDTKVSSAHFAIESHKSGYMLIDLESTNGTLLNSNKVKMTLLKSGDQIEIGATVIKFTMEEHKDISGYIDDADTGKHRLGEAEDEASSITGIRHGSGTERVDVSEKFCFLNRAGKLLKCVLRVTGGFNSGEEYDLQKERTVIGRISADINLDDNKILRKHAMIEIANNDISIRDLSSEEGIYVNERRVHNCRLKGGEKIRMGDTVFELDLEEV